MAQKDFKSFVHTSSRRGVLLGLLGRIWQMAGTDDLYLLRDSTVLRGPQIEQAITQIAALLERIESDPDVICKATKEPYHPRTTIHAQGFEPLEAEVVYLASATIEDGWFYPHRKEQILDALRRSAASDNPRPACDDDGESLEYVFGFLKSQLALLRKARDNDLAIVYAELNN